MAARVRQSQHSSTLTVGEACAHVQDESLKARANPLCAIFSTPRPPGEEAKVRFLLRLIFIIALIAMAISVLSKSNSDPRAESDPENTLNDIMKNHEFLSKHPDFPIISAQLIRANGFTCQRIAIMWVKGPSPYGTKFEVFCGPPDGAGIYESQHYAVYPERLRVTICKATGFLGTGCN
jgi:hypothetical protein